MRIINGFTVYGPNDPNALDEYSEQLAGELGTKFNEQSQQIGEKANESDVLDVLYELLRTEERLNANISTRALITETGNKIALEINNSTFVLTAKLYDKNNNLINTSNEIDLPIESMIVNASYSDGTLTLTLQNGQTLDVDISSIISGLQSEITSSNKLDSDLVDDTNKTNKFMTQAEKTKLAELENYDDTEVKDDIEELQEENTELKEENERLRNDLNNSTLTVSGTGENVTLENTTEARFKKLGVGGNREQFTSTGKNLLDINKYSISNSQSELNGGTYNYNEETGKLTINATNATNTMTIKSTNPYPNYTVLPAGNYYTQVRLNTKKVSDNTSVQYNAGAITIQEDVYITQWFMPVTVGQTKELYMQIEQGSTATDYEPYTGGQPAPNPDYKCPINAVGENGTANVVVCNKNLWGGFSYTRTTSGVTYTQNQDGSIIANGTSTSNSSTSISISDAISQNIVKKLKPGTYTVSGGGSNYRIQVYNMLSTQLLQVDRGSSSGTFTLEKETEIVIRLNVPSGETIDKTIYIQLEENPIATNYTEHQEQDFTIPCQKEMVDETDYFDWENEKEIHGYGMVNLKDLNWEYRNTNSETGLSTYRVDLTGIKQAYNWSVIMQCSHFQYLGRTISGQDAYSKAEGIMRYYATNSTLETIYLNTTISNLADLQTWLNANNVMLVFERESPEQLPFTQAQKDVAKQIKDTAHSYGEKTYVYSPDDVSPIFDVEAIGDINKVIQSLDSRLTLVE